ncbi:polysaccharide biosynthesis protein [Pseudomonas brassicacearum]|uniref:UDP-2,4-diacetamido-2,4, 6-trideoxy-beta-L-altropyranose hydrolase n=1 Tax=Pseudomonas brassicacearum TaxID=930166 RepID=UPI00042E99B4|nr:UDP-2,4-diacetamido-2,4,6-trideoxy-beta-L-altropyranose hydrolase [Pseudomonas brassicacearum]AHL32976.1 polysaccharide biosynthesis protein [Pseudomonas brassicacearum]
MKVVFRADASQQIGTGHVMRCLTLADALNARGAECSFICRAHPGNLIEFIRSKGYPVHSLPFSCPQEVSLLVTNKAGGGAELAHTAWLGTSLEHDVAECAVILGELNTDWLVVDHYALDARWEVALKRHCRKLMVIDDLADRPHQGDLLLDQTFGRNPEDYALWVPATCTLLCGSQYALLRPEFAELRPYSLARRRDAQLRHLLITMGGVDKDNATGQVLYALQSCELPANCRITVVMGATAPWLTEVRQRAEQMPWPTDVRVNVGDMAQLMADSDLAIGAAGSTSWERCCLGLPTVLIVLADNQQQVAKGLEQAGAVYVLQRTQRIAEHLPQALASLSSSTAFRTAMSQAAQRIADGNGMATVIQYLES